MAFDEGAFGPQALYFCAHNHSRTSKPLTASTMALSMNKVGSRVASRAQVGQPRHLMWNWGLAAAEAALSVSAQC